MANLQLKNELPFYTVTTAFGLSLESPAGVEMQLHSSEKQEQLSPNPPTPGEKKEPQSTFTNMENTRIYKDFSGDWMAETKLKVNGKSWVIYTAKFRNKMIGTHCRLVQDEGNGSYSFRLSSNSNNESFYINEVRGIATEKKIKEIHFKSLADFDAKQEAGELPEVKKEYEIKVGQVIFTHGLENERKRVIYEIEAGKFGTIYKSVLLDGSETATDNHLTPWSKKFGIGVYYNEGEILEQDEITDLLISAHENMKQTEALGKVQEQINREQREEKEKYLNQFKQADRRKTSEIVKREILKRWPEVRKVTVKTDVYSGGSSMDIRYYAPVEIEDIRLFIKSFQYGSFNSMEDIYECSGDDAPIIDGYILQTYKYCSAIWEEDNTPLPEKKKNTVPEGITGANVSYNDDKNGIEITFSSNPGRDVINSLKSAGFRWSNRLKLWYAKQTEETKAFSVQFK